MYRRRRASVSVDSAQYPLSKQRCCLYRPTDLGRRTGIDRNVARNRVMSCAFAPAIAMPIGTPRASVTTDRLTPSLPRSVGFLPVFFPAQRCLGHGTVQRLPTPADPASCIVGLQTFLPEAVEDAPSTPFLEVPMCGAWRTELRRQGFPLAAGAQQIEDAVGDSPEIHSRPSTLRTAPIPGQQRLEPLPHFLRHLRKTTTTITIHIRLHAKNK